MSQIAVTAEENIKEDLAAWYIEVFVFCVCFKQIAVRPTPVARNIKCIASCVWK